MKLVYIAGPYRAKTAWQVEQNVRVAEEAGFQLIEQYEAFVPIIPHTMYRFYDGLKNDKYWLEATQQLLLRCDEIVLLPNWTASEGTLGEFLTAVRLGMRIYIYQAAGYVEILQEDEIQNFVEFAEEELKEIDWSPILTG